MDFGDYDDFAADNNPFLGSEHILSGGIGQNSQKDTQESIQQSQRSLLPDNSVRTVKLSQSDSNTDNNGDDCSSNTKIVGYEMKRDSRNARAIFYNIEVRGGQSTFRRYTDFVSLRSYLVKFFQTKVVAPVPEKHSLGRLLKHPFRYKTDIQIIDRRIRLLNYFLDRILSDQDISQSEFVSKFLDPTQKYWRKLLKGPPFTSLSSKSIFLTSPRDPTTPSAYFSYLPIPPRHMLRTYHSELRDSVFKPMETKAKQVLKFVGDLESISNHLMRDLTGEREAMVEMGGLFNIFSIVEDEHEVIESFGNRIDMTFLNIESLVNDLTIQVKEKLMIIRLTLGAIINILRFRNMKEAQLACLENEINAKQTRLEEILSRILGEARLEEVVKNGSVSSPTITRALSNLRLKRDAMNRLDEATTDNEDSSQMTQKSMERWQKAISEAENPSISDPNSGSRSLGFNKPVASMTEEEMQIELGKLGSQLGSQLIPCFRELRNDVEYISVGVEHNVNCELERMVRMLALIIRSWQSGSLGKYTKRCEELWKKQ